MSKRRRMLLLLVASAFLGVVAADAVAAVEVADVFPSLDPGGARHPFRVTFARDRDDYSCQSRDLATGVDEPYVRAADAAQIFRAVRTWDADRMRLTLRIGGETVTFVPGSRLVRREEGDRLLAVPPFFDDGDVWLPLESLRDVLASAMGVDAAWDPQSRTLSLGSARVNVLAATVATGTRSTTLRLSCRDRIVWRTERVADDALSLTLIDATAAGDVRGNLPRRGLIAGGAVVQRDGFVTITVKLSPLVRNWSTTTREDGREILLTLTEGVAGALPVPQPRGRGEVASDESRSAAGGDVRLVVIDPGHGGADAGAVGVDGVREKDVVLEIAKRLRDELRDRGYSVLMTRDDDSDLGPDARDEMANRAGGDLFLSLHANGWYDGTAAGAQTLALAPGPVASTGGTAEGDDARDGAFVRWDRAQWRHLGASNSLATLVQGFLTKRSGASDRGVAAVPARVLEGVDMPAVLVEVGFLTNPREGRDLQTKSRQLNIVVGIADGVDAYRARAAGGNGGVR